MRPKLKENPREWLKFTLSMSAALALVSALLWKKGVLPVSGLVVLLALLVLADGLCLIRPATFRGFYRVGMTVSFYLGQVVGRILLTAFFFVILTPLGLALRLFGKDLLRMRRIPGAKSYWQRSRSTTNLDRQF